MSHLERLKSGLLLDRKYKDEIDDAIEFAKNERRRRELADRLRKREVRRITKYAGPVHVLSVQARRERRQRNKARAKIRQERRHRQHGRQVR